MTGYKGRVGIYEMLEIDSVMRETLTTIEEVVKAAPLHQFCNDHG
jgi:type II secretory ATPase GspE/PulE/Tfp pilus assembly ATPase PilB-like protein